MRITRIAIIDTSGSMDSPFRSTAKPGVITRVTDETHKFEAAKEYLRFAIQKMPASSELILITFDAAATVVYHGPANDLPAIESEFKCYGQMAQARTLAQHSNWSSTSSLLKHTRSVRSML
jgi:hypothetical protein